MTVRKTRSTHLGLGFCGMTESKFDQLGDAASQDNIQIQELQVDDIHMDDGAYRGLVRALGKARVGNFTASGCELTMKKLQSFGGAAAAENLRLRRFQFAQKQADSSVMRELPNTINAAKIQEFAFWKTVLSDVKLREFGEASSRTHAKLRQLDIACDLDLPAVRELPNTVANIRVQRLNLKNCSVTELMFDELGEAANSNGIQIKELQIQEKMGEHEYRGLARAVGKTRSTILVFFRCHLTETKLRAFREEVKRNNVKFGGLIIVHDLMDKVCYREVALTVKIANVNIVELKACQLTAMKLRTFRRSVEEIDVHFSAFAIYLETITEDECCNEIIAICNKTNAELYLDDCNVTECIPRFKKEIRRGVNEWRNGQWMQLRDSSTSTSAE